MTYGVRIIQKSQLIQHPHMKGDTSNPTLIIQHPYMGGDTSNPQDIEPSDQSKIVHIIKGGGGRHFKPPTFGNRQTCESPNKAAQETPNEEDRVLKQLQKT